MMSFNIKLPQHNVYNNNSRSLRINNNKENIPHPMAGRNAIPTPSDDEFDDDDDLLIAASQQFDRKLAQEKAEAAVKNNTNPVVMQLQGENAILREQLTKSSREKEQMHYKKLEDEKAQELKFRKEIENLKSKLEFRDRDVDELRTKLETMENSKDTGQPAKRPRLSVVKMESKKSNVGGAASSRNKQCFRVSARQGYEKIDSSVPVILEENSKKDEVNIPLFLQQLHTNSDLQKRFNVTSTATKAPCSKEVSATVSFLFDQCEKLSKWEEKADCLQILSILQYNELSAEIPKVLKSLSTATIEQHSLLSDMLLKCQANVLPCCLHSPSNTCLLNGLFRFKNPKVLDLLQSSVLQQKESIDPCFCGNEMLKYICIMLKDSLSGSLLSPTIEIEDDRTFHKCLKLLRALSPFFLGMKLNCYVQTLFFGCLDLLKKCSSMSLSGASITDQLFDATFEAANNSMSA